MKKLITICTFLFSASALQAQTINAEQIKKDNVTIKGNALHQLRVDTAYIATLFGVSTKVDSVKRKVASDSVFYYTNGTAHFAFIDSTGGASVNLGNSDLTNTSSTRTYDINGDTLRFHNGQLFYVTIGDTNEVLSFTQFWADTNAARVHAQSNTNDTAFVHVHTNGRIQADATDYIELTADNGVKIVDGTEGTIGHVFTSIGTDGTGAWAAPAGGSGIDTTAWHRDGDAVTSPDTLLGTTNDFNIKVIVNDTGRVNITSRSYHKLNDPATGGLCISCPDTMPFPWNGFTSWRNVLMDTSYNTLLGNLAGENWYIGVTDTLFRNNVAVGKETFRYPYSARNETAVGMEALYYDSAGVENTAIGFGAMHTNKTGFSNVAVGAGSLLANTSGNNNTGLGYNALYANTTGTFNVAVGSGALDQNTTESSNTAVGGVSLGVATAVNNTGLGYYSGGAITTGQGNTAIGSEAMPSVTTTNYSVAIGFRSMYNTTGGANVGVGVLSLAALTTGTFCSGLGYGTDVGSSGLTYATAIGAGTIVKCSDCMVLGDTTRASKVGIGISTPHSTVHNAGSFALAYIAQTSNYTATASDYLVVFTSNVDTLTLPTAVGITGRIYGCKVTGASACVVQGTSGQTIDGASDYPLASQYKYVFVMSNGVNWIIIANN